MSSPSPVPAASVTIPVEQLNELQAIILGVTPVTQTIQEKVGAVHSAQPPVSTESQKEKLDYKTLALEHAELIKQGKTSLEIATWMGEKLNIASWNSGAFYGERKVLSTPIEEEMTRLKAFTQALGVSWTKANGGSDNHSQFLLLDGYIQNALFGQENMTQVNARLDTFHADWQNM